MHDTGLKPPSLLSQPNPGRSRVLTCLSEASGRADVAGNPTEDDESVAPGSHPWILMATNLDVVPSKAYIHTIHERAITTQPPR